MTAVLSSLPGLRLRRLSFHGPAKDAAFLTFGPGLNVLYGASECGKSFVVEAIDFMLGGNKPLRDLPERVGYDQILLAFECLDGEAYTVVRSADGGHFKLYAGLLDQPPAADVQPKDLADQHSERNEDNLSMFLLARCGLGQKRVRKNKDGLTQSLSFRNVARLLIVDETEIPQQRTPLSDGNFTADTVNFSTFKLLLTGVDDSALNARASKDPGEQSKEAQLDLLDQMVGDYRERLKEVSKARTEEELRDQLSRLEASLEQHVGNLRSTEAEFQTAALRRRELRKRLEEGRDRHGEVESLLERFALLDRHYVSDIERLKAIEEGGTLFSVLRRTVCPLCGADPQHHRSHVDCDGDVDRVVAAARREIAKVELLRTELSVTLSDLSRESAGLSRRIPVVVNELSTLSDDVDELIAPKLTKLRASYAEFSDKRSEVREALVLYETIADIERRRDTLKESVEQTRSSVSEGDLPAAVADGFAQAVEQILTTWHFPENGRIHFDPKAKDLVIGGKLRTARGKGLRAITHAAFTLGLLKYCKANGTPHPGFVILDSPLLAYREPDGIEEDLTGTDLKEQFYVYLQGLPSDQQVIIVENTDPPDAIKVLPQVAMFSKNPHSGRYGLFPHTAASAAEPPKVG